MPSPFPGMDPYLESPLYWRSVHGHLLSDMTYALNDMLPEGFVAQYEERCYLLPLPGFVYPDSVVMQDPRQELPAPNREKGMAALAAVTPPLILELHTEEVREPFIEIRAVKDDEPIVTVIELLSPANKTRRSKGNREYRHKQRSVLQSRSHLLEIDLLRGGERTVAAPDNLITAFQRYDYVACLHRAGEQGERFETWPFTIRQAMPTVRVPLTNDLPDLHLELQPLFARVYERSGIGRRLDYQRDPDPAFAPADALWADALLRDNGLR